MDTRVFFNNHCCPISLRNMYSNFVAVHLSNMHANFMIVYLSNMHDNFMAVNLSNMHDNLRYYCSKHFYPENWNE